MLPMAIVLPTSSNLENEAKFPSIVGWLPLRASIVGGDPVGELDLTADGGGAHVSGNGRFPDSGHPGPTSVLALRPPLLAGGGSADGWASPVGNRARRASAGEVAAQPR